MQSACQRHAVDRPGTAVTQGHHLPPARAINTAFEVAVYAFLPFAWGEQRTNEYVDKVAIPDVRTSPVDLPVSRLKITLHVTNRRRIRATLFGLCLRHAAGRE